MTGTLTHKGDEQTFSSGFTKREFVITTEEQYPQQVCFELLKDKTTVIDRMAHGDTLKVAFDVRGREYNGKWFVNLNAFKVEKVNGAAKPAHHEVPIGQKPTEVSSKKRVDDYTQIPDNEDDGANLPF